MVYKGDSCNGVIVECLSMAGHKLRGADNAGEQTDGRLVTMVRNILNIKYIVFKDLKRNKHEDCNLSTQY